MAKHSNFQTIFDEAAKTPAYHVERGVLEFTENLVARMEAEGVTRTDLARRIDCSPAYVTKILRGGTNFTLESMIRIASALGCAVRTHLQPQGVHSQWFDILKGGRESGGAFLSSSEMKKTMHLYAPCGGSRVQKENDDSIPLAS